MALILNIDTALDNAYYFLAENTEGHPAMPLMKPQKITPPGCSRLIDKLIEESGFRIDGSKCHRGSF